MVSVAAGGLGLFVLLFGDWTSAVGPAMGLTVGSVLSYGRVFQERHVIIGPDFVEGPARWGRSRVRMPLAAVDRTTSDESFLGYLRLRSRDGKLIMVDATLSQANRDEIRRLVGLGDAT
jgi:hypothetical protein